MWFHTISMSALARLRPRGPQSVWPNSPVWWPDLRLRAPLCWLQGKGKNKMSDSLSHRSCRKCIFNLMENLANLTCLFKLFYIQSLRPSLLISQISYLARTMERVKSSSDGTLHKYRLFSQTWAHSDRRQRDTNQINRTLLIASSNAKDKTNGRDSERRKSEFIVNCIISLYRIICSCCVCLVDISSSHCQIKLN